MTRLSHFNQQMTPAYAAWCDGIAPVAPRAGEDCCAISGGMPIA